MSLKHLMKMASYKRVISLAFLITLIINVTWARKKFEAKIYTFGNKVPHDNLISQYFVFAPRRLRCHHNYVETFSIPPGHHITRIIAKDQVTSGNYIKCQVLAGGQSKDFVTLQFIRKPLRPIHFIVELYAIWPN